MNKEKTMHLLEELNSEILNISSLLKSNLITRKEKTELRESRSVLVNHKIYLMTKLGILVDSDNGIEMAKLMGVTRQRIDQIEKNALNKLKNTNSIKEYYYDV